MVYFSLLKKKIYVLDIERAVNSAETENFSVLIISRGEWGLRTVE
jgi:hypothetical protein